MPGVAVSPMGSGDALPANCHASPPSESFTSWGALSWYFFGRWFFQMSGGSRMWQSASTMRYFDMEILPVAGWRGLHAPEHPSARAQPAVFNSLTPVSTLTARQKTRPGRVTAASETDRRHHGGRAAGGRV